MKNSNLFRGYPFPKTSEQEVLLTLLTQNHVSIFDFPFLSGFRTRVSQLQTIHGLELNRKLDTRCNKFGNTYSYAIHILPKEQKEKAEVLYLKLTSRNN